MQKFKWILLLLLCLCLALLSLLRWRAKEAPESTQNPTPVESSLPVQVQIPTESPEPTVIPTPVPTPTPTPFVPPQGYTEESYRLVSDMVYAYADRQEQASDVIREDLNRLNTLDPALGSLWEKLMALWSEVNTGLSVNTGVLPDGLPEDESLCIVVLGFQLQSDGTMAPELAGRCETALRSAEKYPRALIAVTGGGTAWQVPQATEAGVMAEWLIAHGIAPERILTEGESRTTADNAVFTSRLLLERHPEVKSLAIVTSDYHMPLGVLLFQEQALLTEYETGTLPFTVVSNAALETGGLYNRDSPMAQKNYLWSLADPHY